MKIKALFASDIDNTLADSSRHIPKQVKEYLEKLHTSGWSLMFLTGRSFTFAIQALEPFQLPYYLAVQNGAEILYMPDKLMVSQNFLSRDILFPLTKIFEEHGEEFFVYSGFHQGDFCYYRPNRVSPEYLAYLKKLQAITPAPWVEVSSWEEVPDRFPFIKCAGSRKSLTHIRSKVAEIKHLSVVVMDDVIDPNKSTLTISHEEATKGKALKKVYQREHLNCPIIAAGDANNDFCLLENADIAIAMEDAPIGLRDLADIIAKSAKQCGIIEALQTARKMLESS